MSKAIHSEDFYLTKLDLKVQQGLSSNLLLSLLPGLRSLFTKAEYDKLQGRLRRNDLEVMKSGFLTEKLEAARNGDIDLSTEAFRSLYQFVSLVKKVPVMGSDQQCKLAGFTKLEDGESQCQATNRRIRSEGFPLTSIFGEVQDLIKTILGPLPANYLNKGVTFGPGSTVNVNNRGFDETCEFFKLTDKLVVPRRARNHLAALISANDGWIGGLATHYHLNETVGSRLDLEMAIFDKHLHVVDDSFPNRIGFVAKNEEEHRSIGIELNGLVLLQKVLGDRIRGCLLRFGLDLNTQERNRHFARFAKTFKKATIDMKNASNTVAFMIVKSLFPYDWFQALSTFRSKAGICPSLDDREVEYEMFSSMGNGFTFELESLIFFATAICQVKKDQNCSYKEALRQVAVFGDDIIVPQDSALNVIESLELFGFSTNLEKSFLKGNFFESCGSDYFNCEDVRPFYLKRQLITTRDLYFFCNSLLFKIIKSESGFLCPAYIYIMKVILNGNYLPGPLHFYEDKSGWQSSHDDLEACLRVPLEFAQKHGSVRFNTNLFSWTYSKYTQAAIEVPLSLSKQYAVQSARYMTFLRGTIGGKATLRGNTETVKKRATTSQWDGLTTNKTRYLLTDIFG